ncbi:hypothetical protein J3R30DRAFT_1469718 [Lentinula aciculospora]|uniref:WD40 repeat-like protein n=1 Tax=Lentinula aciculospora TaxID=153920 RepID=A0A9W9AMN1_9AGAR|nr:hypothetical protein J3R30DRAFT_1469718 [Lentinula aciculospora]
MMQEEQPLLPDFANLQIDVPSPFSSYHDHVQYYSGRSHAVDISAKSTALQIMTRMLRRSRGKSKRQFDNFCFTDPASRLNRIRSPAPSTFRTSAGAINKIVQHKHYTFLASSVVGGHPDEPGETENSYNRPGTLIAWKGFDHSVLDGHSRQPSFPAATNFPKNYTVNDVAICPTTQHDDADESQNHVLISTGNDYRMKMWKQSTNDSLYELLPQPSLVDSQVLVHSEVVADGLYDDVYQHWGTSELSLTLREGNRAGPIKWGCDLTASLLFASSESCADTSGVGDHKAFDVSQERESFRFDLNEDGDALAVDAFGERVALFTIKSNDDNMVEDDHQNAERILRIYDVRRKDGRHQAKVTHAVKLEPSEVKCASFSPDGIYLAVGRLDGHTVIYDSRFMSETLYDFAHDGPSLVSPGNDSYGITHLEWRVLHHNHLGLMTGGPDGCVRLWQPHWAPRITEQGRTIAQANADVGYFTIGDRFQGEHELVIQWRRGWRRVLC